MLIASVTLRADIAEVRRRFEANAARGIIPAPPAAIATLGCSLPSLLTPLSQTVKPTGRLLRIRSHCRRPPFGLTGKSKRTPSRFI
jgi:hypothetical protein